MNGTSASTSIWGTPFQISEVFKGRRLAISRPKPSTEAAFFCCREQLDAAFLRPGHRWQITASRQYEWRSSLAGCISSQPEHSHPEDYRHSPTEPCAQIRPSVQVAPSNFAFIKIAPVRFAPRKLAPLRSASSKFAFLRLASMRFAP